MYKLEPVAEARAMPSSRGHTSAAAVERGRWAPHSCSCAADSNSNCRSSSSSAWRLSFKRCAERGQDWRATPGSEHGAGAAMLLRLAGGCGDLPVRRLPGGLGGCLAGSAACRRGGWPRPRLPIWRRREGPARPGRRAQRRAQRRPPSDAAVGAAASSGDRAREAGRARVGRRSGRLESTSAACPPSSADDRSGARASCSCSPWHSAQAATGPWSRQQHL